MWKYDHSFVKAPLIGTVSQVSDVDEEPLVLNYSNFSSQVLMMIPYVILIETYHLDMRRLSLPKNTPVFSYLCINEYMH